MTFSSLTQMRRFPISFLYFSLLLLFNYYAKRDGYRVKQNNQALKEQVDALSKEVLKETFITEGVANSGDNRNINFEHRNCEKSTIFERR